MRLIIIIVASLFVLGSPLFLLSQSTSIIPSSSVSLPDSNTTISQPGKKFGFVPGKISSGLQVGTIFLTTKGYGSGFTTYVSPYISYPFSSRFRIDAGISVFNSNYYGIRPYTYAGTESPANGYFTNAMVYVSGDYLVNERLTISGTLYKSFNILSSSPGKYPYSGYDAQGAFMKVGYKVFDNFHIEAGFGYSKGADPFNPIFGSPLYHDIFTR